MTNWVVDTNVPIVANGRNSNASASCQLASIQVLHDILGNSDRIVIDFEGEVLSEYRKHLSPSGQPGVGDRFLQLVFASSPGKVLRLSSPRDAGGELAHFPLNPALANFDPSDRKFAALAIIGNCPILNSTDSDWLQFKDALAASAIVVMFVCGEDQSTWHRP